MAATYGILPALLFAGMLQRYLVLLLLGVSLARCGEDGLDLGFPRFSEGTDAGGAAAISIPPGAAQNTTSSGFEPSVVRVLTDSPVTWVNDDSAIHTVTSVDNEFESGDIRPGDSYEHEFTEEGSFRYACRYHPEETGQVDVVLPVVTVDPGTAASPVPSPSPPIPQPSVPI